MQRETSDLIPSKHAALAGHFPGNPVVPAVVILDRVRNALDGWPVTAPIMKIYHAKFVAVLRPDEKFKITLASADSKKFSFDCQKEDGVRFAYGEFLAGSSNNA